MSERRKLSFTELCVKYGSFRRSVLRFGLPFIVIYYIVNYIIFRAAKGNAGVRYPWERVIIPDLLYLFLVSALWWILMRVVSRAYKKGKEEGR